MRQPAYLRGDVLLAELVFTSSLGTKTRPVLVVFDFGDDDLLVVPITSHAARSAFDLVVQHWKESGLKLPSTIRSEKLATIAKSTVSKKLGKLSTSDLANFEQKLSALLERVRA